MPDALDLMARALALPVSSLILLNGLDDIFIDFVYFWKGLFRRKEHRIRAEDLKRVEPKRIAIMVPTWQESEVIGKMLELNLGTIDYPADRYDFFVGTYVNDIATQDAIDELARRVKNVHRVITPHDGPTSKADNLNWVYQGLKLVEEKRGARFDILLMHDAEDIIHPLALRLYNFWIPKYEFVQTPVLPLPLPLHRLVAGTYIDEFTEYHLKDMLVRERLGGLVPSAGVGSAFERSCFEEIAFSRSELAFSPESLTEDYEIGLAFRLRGKRALFLTRAVARLKKVQPALLGRKSVPVEVEEYIATREYFPDTFWGSVRQRSRWVLGIALQTWDRVGWRGSAPVLYCLYRDRKALLTSFLGPLGYVLAIYCVVRWLGSLGEGVPWTFDNVFPVGSLLWYIVLANTLILGWRVVMKMVVVEEIYGPLHALMSIPRFVVANVIALLATVRAMYQFLVHKVTGRPLRWLKTAHVFPSADVLRDYHRSLGELLVDREGLTQEDLENALRLQALTGVRLGGILSHTGLASPERVAQALGDQLAMPVVNPNPYDIPLDLLGRLGEAEAESQGVLPLHEREDGAVVLAVARSPNLEMYERLEEVLGAKVSFAFCLETQLNRARARAYRRLSAADPHRARPRPLGEELVASGLVSSDELDRLLREQEEVEEPLGELAVLRGLLPADALSDILLKRVGLPFRTLDLEDANPRVLRRLGYGICSLYGVVPLANRGGGPIPLACSHPLHAETLALCAARTGLEFAPVLAPEFDIRLLLSLTGEEVWPQGIHLGASGMDGSELQALSSLKKPEELVDLGAACLRSGLGPIEYLEHTRQLDTVEAARIRGLAIGVPLASDEGPIDPGTTRLLPEELVETHGLRVIHHGANTLVLSAPRPSAMLSRQLATLLPDIALAWRVGVDTPGAGPQSPTRPVQETP